MLLEASRTKHKSRGELLLPVDQKIYTLKFKGFKIRVESFVVFNSPFPSYLVPLFQNEGRKPCD